MALAWTQHQVFVVVRCGVEAAVFGAITGADPLHQRPCLEEPPFSAPAS